MSFLAFRRVATMLRLLSVATSGGRKQMVPIDADDLRAALTADREN